MPLTIDYKEKGEKVEVDKGDFERLLATIETLEDKEVLKQLSDSKEDKEEGRLNKWSEVKERIGV
jgi:hypothetical protein